MSQPQTIPYSLVHGLDVSKSSMIMPPGSLFEMTNFRQSDGALGVIESTPRFYLLETLARGTYWSIPGGVSATEPATSNIEMIVYKTQLNRFVMTSYTFYLASTQVQAYYQTTVPTANNINTQLLLDIVNPTGLAIALGSTLDVAINTDATHFHWRKNGGAWSADILITTTGVSIDGGNAVLYFQTDSGFDFATPSAWSWTRTDCSWEVLAGDTTVVHEKFVRIGDDIYFLNLDSRVMVYKGSTGIVRSVGYRPIYGHFLEEFYAHLFVFCAGTTEALSATTPGLKTVANSDLNDFDNFFPTDVNEADSVVLPLSSRLSFDPPCIVDCFKFNKEIYAVTTTALYATPYYGLPLVFSFERRKELPMYYDTLGVPRACLGGDVVYFVTQSGIFQFDGSTFTTVGEPCGFFSAISADRPSLENTRPFYNTDKQELIIHLRSTNDFLVYQERYRVWYKRKCGVSTTLSIATAASKVYLGGSSLKIFTEDLTNIQTPVYDFAQSSFATPTLTFHLLHDGRLSNVKETLGCYLFAVVKGGASTYSLTTDINANVFWGVCNNGQLSVVVPTYVTATTGAVWSTSVSDGFLSGIRFPFRAVSFRITLTGLVSGKPAAGIYITGFEPYVSGFETERRVPKK